MFCSRFMIIPFLILLTSNAFSQVRINELSYNMPDGVNDAGSNREFIELFNPQPDTVDLSGCKVTGGVEFTFPEGTIMESNTYLVIARAPNYRTMRRITPLVGPYEGFLSNSGERITLARPDGSVMDSVKYKDTSPWPIHADGYGRTLERIAWELPTDDYHSWRCSLKDEGTPGKINSVTGMLSRPMIQTYNVTPAAPHSTEAVIVQLQFDGSADIQSVDLHWEKVDSKTAGTERRNLFTAFDVWNYWVGELPPSPNLEWTQREFDDSTWTSANGIFGYGFQGINTPVNISGKASTLYIRKQFSIGNPAVYKTIELTMYYTGGYVCYLNGREIDRANAPQEVTNTSLATSAHNLNDYKRFIIQNADEYLVEGDNVLAVVGLNNKLNSPMFTVAPFMDEGQKIFMDTGQVIPMNKMFDDNGMAIYQAELPPQPSQSLVRFSADLKLTQERTLHLPNPADVYPFYSYFVYDGEVESVFPVLWLFNPVPTFLTGSQVNVGGAVICPPDTNTPQVFDCALVKAARNGHKLKFIKGREYQGNRTLNIIPETPQEGTSSGFSAPYREHLGLWFFKDMKILTPDAEFFRVIENGGVGQTQRLVVQQVNEVFLEKNGRNPSGDLYKRLWYDPFWEKHTNLENGNTGINDLTKKLRPQLPDFHQVVVDNFDVNEFLNYSVASVLTSNWDGFHNNNWMYLNPDTGKWEIIPWDLDKVWGYGDSNHYFVEMPIEFPLNGRAKFESREPGGPIIAPLHKDAEFHAQYKSRLRDELYRSLEPNRMGRKIDEDQAKLLDDLALLEYQTHQNRSGLRNQITESYRIIRNFVTDRRNYLFSQLGTSVEDWSVY